MNEPGVVVAASHGTRSRVGRLAVRGIVEAVARRAPGLEVVEAFVDVQQPRVADVVASLERPCVVVPLLLAPGHHLHVDISRAVEPAYAVAARTLGPDLRIAQLLVEGLERSGADRHDAVVLAASGSSDLRARRAVEQSASLVSLLWGTEVTIGYLGGAGTPIDVALADARRTGRRAVAATFLLAPGFFHDRLLASAADLVTSPLLDGAVPDPRLVDIVLDRVAEASGERSWASGRLMRWHATAASR